VVVSEFCGLFCSPEFYHDMKLAERFSDIKITGKVRLYDRDPHGWVLPGDPEWDGVFRHPPGWVEIKRQYF
jgi:hypothetical protein